MERQEFNQLNHIAVDKAKRAFREFLKLLRASQKMSVEQCGNDPLSEDMIKWIVYAYKWGWWEGFHEMNLQNNRPDDEEL